MKYLNHLIEKKKKKEKITMLTAYDFFTAKLIDEAGIDMILVGDSYGMVKLGYETTLPVSMEEMLIATKSVSRGITNSILIADMPFLSYQSSEKDAIFNAARFLKETKAQGVKIESSEHNVSLIEKLVKLDIPIMGHIGLTPQAIYRMGGYKIQGKTAESAKKLYSLAKSLEDAGVFALVLEGMTSECAKKITEDLRIPTIGIGAGPFCDGQVLVFDDMVGLNNKFVPKHSKKYANLWKIMKEAVLSFKKDVEDVRFPSKENSFFMPEEELKLFD